MPASASAQTTKLWERNMGAEDGGEYEHTQGSKLLLGSEDQHGLGEATACGPLTHSGKPRSPGSRCLAPVGPGAAFYLSWHLEAERQCASLPRMASLGFIQPVPTYLCHVKICSPAHPIKKTGYRKTGGRIIILRWLVLVITFISQQNSGSPPSW